MYYRMNHLYIPFSGVVKKLVIVNVVIWIFLQVIIDNLILQAPFFTSILGLSVNNFFNSFFIWEPMTYMFLHSQSAFHIFFNMLLLWWLGAELEYHWGSRFFLTYYLACGFGAGLIFLTFNALYSIFVGPINHSVLIGASGAIYGLMLAFAILFGNRIVLFMFLFPMKVKWIVIILGTIQLVSMLQEGIDSRISYLAHLGGIASGWIFLVVWTKYQNLKRERFSQEKRTRKFRLIINEDPPEH